MIAYIIQWSLRSRLFVLAAAALLLGWGTVETLRMPVDVFPDLTAPAVTVVTEAHGMAPTEVERLVTFPVETALNGAPGVRRVRSTTGIGLSTVIVEFDWSTDVLTARQIVAEKLQLARASLPPEAAAPVMAPAASVMGEIMFIALGSDRHDGMALKAVADWTVRKRILAVPGVAEVLPIGGDERQYQVTLRLDRLAAYGITVDEVLAALKDGNQNAPAGFYAEGGQEYLIQGIGRMLSAEDVGATAVARRGGIPVLVRDVAEVAVGPGIRRGIGSNNGRPAVVMGIQKQPGVNTLELTRRLDAVFADLGKTLPPGMELATDIFRQADFIKVSVKNLVDALRDGAILVVAIVFAFLMNGRATLITLTALPLSLVAAIVAMKAMGASINTMTLGGLAIALGALVDDAIIVVENIVRRLDGNRRLAPDQRQAAIHVVFEATREIQGSIVFATLIIMLVFLPLFFLTGVEGRLMVPLGLAYVISLAASLFVAITVTPVMASLLLVRERKGEHREPALIRWLVSRYDRVLAATLTRWKAVAWASGIALALAMAALGLAGKAFLPDFNEGTLTISASTLPGTSLEESAVLGQMVEDALLRQPEVAATARRTGRSPLDPHALGIHESEIEVSLAMKERSKEEFLDALRRDFAAIPGMNIIVGQPISHRIDHMLSGSRANIAIKIFGTDLYDLRRVAAEIKAVAAKVPGAVDVAAEQQTDIPFLTVKFDRGAIARHGLTLRQVADAIEAAFAGVTVSKIMEGQATYDLVVRYDPKVRDSLEAIRETLITTSSGARLPLLALASVTKDRGPNSVSRENVQRKIVVTANVAGRDLGSVVEEMRAKVEAEVKLPAGYHIEFGGQFESAAEATRTLGLLSLVVVAGIFLLLFLAFRSVKDALLVMLNLPLALIGGVAGIYLTGGVMTIAGLIGLITLFGIATRNGVMMIAHIHHLAEREGVADPAEAVRRGARERLVPILMTALAAGLALIPLAASGGQPGSEVQAPMAVVILCGLVSSTILNMVVVPALYLRFGAVRRELERHDTVRRRVTDMA
ncbi:putative Heavy metal efflux pump, CzcA family [Magnetospirillum sp. XM-1]|uniref:efflux RND transporter permease subunit n=1 Tax=Magnetospirillum sp. XM-1 TaxID=1663591 RepID=UPI00073DBEAC|nr:efflux RND transporter permease subunit [Magnetospirillum sp. XM-1]CUW39586.1 putative Heavy metal efflux pump, CzcA family [Magnetospirillum sp. XM-1]